MSDQIQFEGENPSSRFQSRAVFGQPQTPKMVKFLIDKGIVKSERSAGHLLLAVTVLFFCSTIFIYAYYVFRIGQPAPVPFISG